MAPSTFQLDLRVYGALPTPGGPVFAAPQTMRPFFDREPRHDLDQTPQARRAGGGETLKAAIAVALGLKLTRQIVHPRRALERRPARTSP